MMVAPVAVAKTDRRAKQQEQDNSNHFTHGETSS